MSADTYREDNGEDDLKNVRAGWGSQYRCLCTPQGVYSLAGMMDRLDEVVATHNREVCFGGYIQGSGWRWRWRLRLCIARAARIMVKNYLLLLGGF